MTYLNFEGWFSAMMEYLDSTKFWAQTAMGGVSLLVVGLQPTVQLLLMTRAADISLGWTVAFGKKTLSPRECWFGVMRKGAAVMMVVLMSQFAPIVGHPLGTWFAGFLLLHEATSVLANWTLLGMPTPPWLSDALTSYLKSKYKFPDRLLPPAEPVQPEGGRGQ